MGYTKIIKEDMDDKLKSEKGWFCTRSGNEYIYDFHLSKLPIIIKVASSVIIDTDRKRNRGSDAIRIYAVRKEALGKKAKIVAGLVKASRVYRMGDWRKNLEEKVHSTILRSKIVYSKWQVKNSRQTNF